MKLFIGVLFLLIGYPFYSFCQLDTSFNHTGKILQKIGSCDKIFIDKDIGIIIIGAFQGIPGTNTRIARLY